MGRSMLRGMKRSMVVVLLLLAACGKQAEAPSPEPQSAATHQSEIRQWQQDRARRLRSEDSWLSLVGLFWLVDGDNRFGSDRGKNSVVMPAKAPADLGTLTLKDSKVTMAPASGSPMTIGGRPVEAPVELIADTAPNGPTVVQLGTMQFQIVERSGRFAVRVKDPQSEARTQFAGLDYFPVNQAWRVEAKFEPYNPPRKVPITNVIGMTSEEVSPGALVFTVEGQTYRLDPISEQGSTDLFVIFKDETSRDATYGAGRYLYVKPAGADGTVIVDFNKAYNPPCAFTDYATCPLPAPQNRLKLRIEAGEKRYSKGHT